MNKVKLKEICRLINGRAYKQQELLDNGKYPVLRVGNFFSDKDYYYSDLELEEDKYCDNGDLLFAWSASFGPKIWSGGKVIYHYHIWKMELSERVDRDYLYYYLLHLSERIKSEGHGGIMIHTTKAEMEEREFALPELTHQRQIAELLSKAASVIEMRKQELQKLDELIKARFVEMFGLPVSNTKKWKTEQMGEIAPAVNYKGEFDDEIWLLNLDMVEAQTGRIIDYLIVSEDEVGNSTCTFDTSNVLYSKLRPYLNKVVIPDRCGYATSELVPLQPVNSKLNREYFAFMLRSDEFVSMINEKVAGAKMPRVSMGDFRKFDVPVPPLELQEQFAECVKQVDKSKVIENNACRCLKYSLMPGLMAA